MTEIYAVSENTRITPANIRRRFQNCMIGGFALWPDSFLVSTINDPTRSSTSNTKKLLLLPSLAQLQVQDEWLETLWNIVGTLTCEFPAAEEAEIFEPLKFLTFTAPYDALPTDAQEVASPRGFEPRFSP